jgi:hypothetical protein
VNVFAPLISLDRLWNLRRRKTFTETHIFTLHFTLTNNLERKETEVASSTNLLKDRTEKEWAAMKDGDHYFYIIGLDGERASIWLDLSGGRGRVRHADFCIQGDHWKIAEKANEQLWTLYIDYWRLHWKQRPKKHWRAPGSKNSVRIDFLSEDSGMWLYRAAQFLSDPRNLYDSIFDLDPRFMHEELAFRRIRRMSASNS